MVAVLPVIILCIVNAFNNVVDLHDCVDRGQRGSEIRLGALLFMNVSILLTTIAIVVMR